MRTLLSGTGLCLVLLSAPAQTQTPSQPSTTVHLHYAQFDPATATPQIPVLLRGDERTNLWIVQFQGRPTDRARDAIRAEGAQVHGYLPENAHVVRMSHAVAADVRQNRSVRSESIENAQNWSQTPAFSLYAAGGNFARGTSGEHSTGTT